MDHLLHYSINLKERSLAVQSIRGWLSALAFANKALGFHQYTSDFQVQKMLERWSRESGICRDTKQPVSPFVLKGLLATWGIVSSSLYEAALFHAVALVAFFGALQISELVVQSQLLSVGPRWINGKKGLL